MSLKSGFLRFFYKPKIPKIWTFEVFIYFFKPNNLFLQPLSIQPRIYL